MRFTYTARVHRPEGLVAAMSVENNAEAHNDTSAVFRMTRPIPSYLVALAVGDLSRVATGPRTAVYAEPDVIVRAANEFGETEKILSEAEGLYGEYLLGAFRHPRAATQLSLWRHGES